MQLSMSHTSARPITMSAHMFGEGKYVAVDLIEADGGELSVLIDVGDGWDLVARLDGLRARLAVALEDAGYPPPASLEGPEVERLRGELDVVTEERDQLLDKLSALRGELDAVTDARDRVASAAVSRLAMRGRPLSPGGFIRPSSKGA